MTVSTALFYSFLGLIFKPVERDASYLSIIELLVSFLATFCDHYAQHDEYRFLFACYSEDFPSTSSGQAKLSPGSVKNLFLPYMPLALLTQILRVAQDDFFTAISIYPLREIASPFPR